MWSVGWSAGQGVRKTQSAACAVHIPASASGDIPAEDMRYTQMSLTIDGTTGELLGTNMYHAERELAVAALPTLKLPARVQNRVALPQRFCFGRRIFLEIAL